MCFLVSVQSFLHKSMIPMKPPKIVSMMDTFKQHRDLVVTVMIETYETTFLNKCLFVNHLIVLNFLLCQSVLQNPFNLYFETSCLLLILPISSQLSNILANFFFLFLLFCVIYSNSFYLFCFCHPIKIVSRFHLKKFKSRISLLYGQF